MTEVRLREAKKNSQRTSFSTNMKHELKSEYMCAHTSTHSYGTTVRSQICMSISDMGALNNSEPSWGHIYDVL